MLPQGYDSRDIHPKDIIFLGDFSWLFQISSELFSVLKGGGGRNL